MPDPLTAADVDRVAALAQLELTDEERRTFVHQLNEILGYAQQISALDTRASNPLRNVSGHLPIARNNCVPPSVLEALAAAPEAAPSSGCSRSHG